MRSFGLKRFVCAVVALGLGICVANENASAISGTTNIEGQLEMKGASVVAGEFTFELRKSGSDTVLATTTNRADGKIVFENIPYSDADIVNEKYVIYEVSEVRGDDETIVYDSNVGYVVITLDEGTGEVANIDYTKPNSEDISYEDYEYQTYHASDEELQGVAYAVYDSRDRSLVFFRAEEGAYSNQQFVYLDGGDFLEYVVVPEDTVPGFDMDSSFSYGWQVRSVRFKDAVRPMDISFEYASSCKSFDLRKLDTSRMTNMSNMFRYMRGDNIASSVNISGFDTSDVTSMEYFFYDSQDIERVIWGHLDTSKVEKTNGAFHNTKLEYFDFSRFDTTSLTDASDRFFSNTNTLNKMDVSTWKSNGEASWDDIWYNVNNYNTQTFAGAYSGEYLDISSWGKTYSAEFYNMNNLKVLKICMPGTAQRGPFFSTWPMINIETGEIIDGALQRVDACGTYVTLGYDSMKFTNRKKSSIEVQKTDVDGNPLPGATLGLKMDGSIIYSWDTDGSAKVFHDLAFGHSYEIVELDAPAGYRKAEPISFEVNENGVVTSGGEVVSSITMADEEDKVEVKKVWDDSGMENFRPETIKFELYNVRSNEKVDEITLSQANANSLGDWEGTFRIMNRYDIDGYENSYKVVEESLVNYTTTYQVDDSSTPSTVPIISNSVIVTNKYTGAKNEYSFKKQWDDAGFESERPESVSFKLYEQSNMSKAVREVTLTADNADENDANTWRGVFEELPSLNSDGSAAKYVIVEDALTGYKASYVSLEDENDIDILEFNCELDDIAGNFLGIVTDVTDEGSGTVHMRQFSFADSSITRLSAESSNYEILISPFARCTGSVVRGSRDSLTTNYSESEVDSSSYGDSFGRFTFEPVTRDDIFTAEPTWDMNRPNTFALNKEDYVPVTEEQSEPFAGANLIINRPISEEEVTPDTPETKDKIVKSVVILATTLGLGIGAFYVGGARKRSR